MTFHIGISPRGYRTQKTKEQPDKSWAVHVRNRKPPADKNEVASMRFIGETTNKQAKWLVTMADGKHRTIWTDLEERSEL